MSLEERLTELERRLRELEKRDTPTLWPLQLPASNPYPSRTNMPWETSY